MTTLIAPVREVTQSVLFSEEAEAAEIYGNCLAAALAAALGMSIDAVPNFASFTWWDAAARLWLRGRSLDCGKPGPTPTRNPPTSAAQPEPM